VTHNAVRPVVGVGLTGLAVGAVLAHNANGHGPLKLLPPLVLLLVGVLVSPASLTAERLGCRRALTTCLLVATGAEVAGAAWPVVDTVCAFVVGVAVALVQPLTLLAVRQWCAAHSLLAAGVGMAGFALGALSPLPIGVCCVLPALWWLGLGPRDLGRIRSYRRVPPLPFGRRDVWWMAVLFGAAMLLLDGSVVVAAVAACVLLPRVLLLPLRAARAGSDVVPLASLMFGLGHLGNGLVHQLV